MVLVSWVSTSFSELVTMSRFSSALVRPSFYGHVVPMKNRLVLVDAFHFLDITILFR